MPARSCRSQTASCVIEKEGKMTKLVNEVEHVSFSGRRGVEQGQDVTYVTERCVMKLTPEGIVLTEIAPGVDLQALRARPVRVPANRFRQVEDDGCLPVRRGADRPDPAAQARAHSCGGGTCLNVSSHSSGTAPSASSHSAVRKNSTRWTSRCCARWKQRSTLPRMVMPFAPCSSAAKARAFAPAAMSRRGRP